MRVHDTVSPLTRYHDWIALATMIVQWGRELGFQEVGVADTDLSVDEVRLLNWLDKDRHGEMDYMARHGVARARPAELYLAQRAGHQQRQLSLLVADELDDFRVFDRRQRVLPHRRMHHRVDIISNRSEQTHVPVHAR